MPDSTTLQPDRAEKQTLIDVLSRRFRRPLQRYFEKRIGRQADTEDLVQLVFLRLAAGGRVESSSSVEGYLFKIAGNLLRDRQRRALAHHVSAHEPYEEDIHGQEHSTFSPERLVQSSQMIEQLVAAAYELPERTLEVFTLYHLHGLSHAQIASRMGIAISTIEKHMARANVHLLGRVKT